MDLHSNVERKHSLTHSLPHSFGRLLACLALFALMHKQLNWFREWEWECECENWRGHFCASNNFKDENQWTKQNEVRMEYLFLRKRKLEKYRLTIFIYGFLVLWTHFASGIPRIRWMWRGVQEHLTYARIHAMRETHARDICVLGGMHARISLVW